MMTDCPFNRPVPEEVRYELPRVVGRNNIVKISFYNVLTTHVTDKPPKRTTYPQYLWKKRVKPMIQLLAEERADVTGLCELDLAQVKSFLQEMQVGGKLEGYQLVGFASETQENIEETARKFTDAQQEKYGEFIAFLVSKHIKVEELSCYSLWTDEGQKWKRILVRAKLFDTISKTQFVCLCSHFDHISSLSRRKSVEKEIELLRDLEKEQMPWFSIGDRNWSTDIQEDIDSARRYLQEPFISDFRDDTKLGEFGPPGTFPGYLWLEGALPEVVTTSSGKQILSAPTIDVGYKSKNFVEQLYYYAKTGEFDPASYDLLPKDKQGDLAKRNFASDHYLIGGVFRFKSQRGK